MQTARFTAGLWIVFFGAFLLSAAEPPVMSGPPLKFDLTGNVMDGPNLAYAMMRTFMSDQEWQQRVADFRKRFETWEHDNHGDMGQFLNDRLILVALGAAGGEVSEVQKGVAYLALYKEFRQVPPSLVLRFMKEHKESVTELLSSFTWENASEYVKNKRWREDIARRKARAKQAQTEAKTQDGKPDQTGAIAAVPAPQPVYDVVATPPAAPAAEALPPATLQVMSLKWDTLTEPFIAETPLRSK